MCVCVCVMHACITVLAVHRHERETTQAVIYICLDLIQNILKQTRIHTQAYMHTLTRERARWHACMHEFTHSRMLKRIYLQLK